MTVWGAECGFQQHKMQFLILLLIQVVTLISLFTNSSVLAVTVNPCPPGMILISGATFKMGAGDSGFVEERTGENVTVSSFCIDKYEVTNAQFTQFVKATKYVTVAERPLSKEQFPDLSDKERLPGSLVFQMPKPGVKQIQLLSWWHWTPGANWRYPFDMTGNVWEWTSDWFNDRYPTSLRSRVSVNPTETAPHVIKGGSYLCAPNYCSRYRPAARESESPDTGTTHIGFRLVKNLQD